MNKVSLCLRLLATALLGAIVSASIANAQNSTFEFDTIDAVRIGITSFRVEGKRAGVDVQSEWSNWIPPDRSDFCYKLAVVAFTQGQPFSIVVRGDGEATLCTIGKGKAL